MNIPYNLEIEDVSYENNTEFRQVFRKVFCMVSAPDDSDGIDLISQDENDYDADNVTLGMDFVFKHTHNNSYFQVLFDYAAAKMMSTDQEIGLAVLFSYDNFADFHKCVVEYMRDKDKFDDSCESYKNMYEKIK